MFDHLWLLWMPSLLLLTLVLGVVAFTVGWMSGYDRGLRDERCARIIQSGSRKTDPDCN